MSAEDTPRSLTDPAEIARRRGMLTLPHIQPLARYCEQLRAEGHLGAIPDFDPCDGGINARILFLFEKPSAKAFDSGFISRNNNDQTAVHTMNFMREANIPRGITCTWNIVPGWNGTMKITAAELKAGHAALRGLTALLPHLKAVVLVGRKAELAGAELAESGYPIISSLHPSPLNRGFAPDKWARIGDVWAEALAYLD